jgi:hypothetical protein
MCEFKNGRDACNIPNQVLHESPYFLPVGHMVIAKIRARNSKGWGPFSPVNAPKAAISMIELTSSPTLETTVNHANKTATLSWTTHEGSQYSELYSDAGRGENFALVHKGPGLTFTAENLIPGTAYQFKLKSKNCCGGG